MHDIKPRHAQDSVRPDLPSKLANTPRAEKAVDPSMRRLPLDLPKPSINKPSATKPAKQKSSSKASLALDKAGPVDIDRRNWEKLKRGDVKLEGRIDLHGMTQEEAHDRLNHYLQAMQARGARCILVITGMGRSDGGVLRQMVPRWLAEPYNRQRIVTYTQAQLKHGGDGALYVLLKRLRPKG